VIYGVFAALVLTAGLLFALTVVFPQSNPAAQVGAGAPTVAPAPPGMTAAAAALATLETLPVLPARPEVAGYQRGCGTGQACSFGPAWTDDTEAPGGHNGCGSRDDVLGRQLTHVGYRAGSSCVVVSGVLADPYSGQTVVFSKAQASDVQVDHIVPIALAWDLGAWAWTQDRRNAFANDVDAVLVATTRRANEAKSDSGPAAWMPGNLAYRCSYDVMFIAVLAKYDLPVVQADKDAMAPVLAGCGA
jgi:hypothetical protein